jgi:O-antigen/teichoic acid export membrane protein
MKWRKLNNKHFFSLAGTIIISAFSLLIMAILYRQLPSKEAVGTWVLFQTVLALIDTVRSGLLTTAAIKFFAGASTARVNAITGATWWMGVAITGVVLLLNLPALFAINKLTDVSYIFIIKWIGLAFFLTLPMVIANCTLQGAERFDRLLYMRLFNQGLFFVLVLVFSLLHLLSIHTVLYSFLITSFLTGVFIILKGWTNIGAWKYTTKAVVKEMYHFGKYTVGTTISANLLRASDIFLIKLLFPKGKSEAIIGIYRLGLLSLEIVEIPLRSFIATGMTDLSIAQNQHRKEDFIYLIKKYTGVLVMLIIPAMVAAWLLADLAIFTMAGNKYMGTEAANIIRIFMTFAILFPFDRFFALSLDVLHQPQINYYKVLVMLAVNIVGDVVGYYLTGNIYGIAMATFLPTLVGAWVGYYYLRKRCPFTIGQIFTTGWVELKLIAKKIQY